MMEAPSSVSEDSVLQFFEGFHLSTEHIKICGSLDSSKRIVFVTFKSEAEAQRAILEKNKSYLESSRIDLIPT